MYDTIINRNHLREVIFEFIWEGWREGERERERWREGGREGVIALDLLLCARMCMSVHIILPSNV